VISLGTSARDNRVDHRHRTVADQGDQRAPGSRTAGIAMTYKLIDAAHTRWRAVNAAPGRCRPCRRRVPQGKAARTTRRHHARPAGPINRNGGRL